MPLRASRPLSFVGKGSANDYRDQECIETDTYNTYSDTPTPTGVRPQAPWCARMERWFTDYVRAHRREDGDECPIENCGACTAWVVWEDHPEWDEIPVGWSVAPKETDPFKRAIIEALKRERRKEDASKS